MLELRTAPREVLATRYVVPLREGGSLPAICEADDLGTYVVKFRGAGQGRKALVAEVIVARLARAVGFDVPELVTIQVDAQLPGAEPDPEIHELLRSSLGRNLGVDYLPGSLAYDPAADDVDGDLAARIVWFDALVSNVDRSWRNPNLLVWHGQLWLIDHGAALIFAHDWARAATAAERPYQQVAEHALLGVAGPIAAADAALASRLDRDAIRAAVADVPDDWLADEPGFGSAEAVRDAYTEVLVARLAARDRWVPGLEAARAPV